MGEVLKHRMLVSQLHKTKTQAQLASPAQRSVILGRTLSQAMKERKLPTANLNPYMKFVADCPQQPPRSKLRFCFAVLVFTAIWALIEPPCVVGGFKRHNILVSAQSVRREIVISMRVWPLHFSRTQQS